MKLLCLSEMECWLMQDVQSPGEIAWHSPASAFPLLNYSSSVEGRHLLGSAKETPLVSVGNIYFPKEDPPTIVHIGIVGMFQNLFSDWVKDQLHHIKI